ncbi:hypothetical protein DPEC_G00020230 [Dallia pectoralis]|uniref:Uncharacterized protein n=1 Tax=Dallia pectoralis TaxID=75939 RepID=A0ACC2HFW2_DALPE|nr:hypothetical protein DPEC_G00020230 [Dallia pectoralis]
MTTLRKRIRNLAVVARVQFDQDKHGVTVQRVVTSKGKLSEDHDGSVRGSQFRGSRNVPCSLRGRECDSPARRQRSQGSPGPEHLDHFHDSIQDMPQDGSFPRRFDPYNLANQRGHWRVERDKKGGDDNAGGGGRKKNSWYKMTIPYGKKYEKKWLLTALQNKCSVPFTAVQYQTVGRKAQFYVEDAFTAHTLCGVSGQITDRDGYKVIVLMNLCPPPSILNTVPKPQDIKCLKQCMAKRLDVSQRALNLHNLNSDPDLVSQNISTILSRKIFVEAVVNIIQEKVPELVCLNLSNNKLYHLNNVADLIGNAPHLKTLNLSHNELKTENELDMLKGIKLVELWLEYNPVCDKFKDQHTYISAIRERFPGLLQLDGHVLPLPIVFEMLPTSTIPPCKGSYFGSEEIMVPILHFLQQYFSVYDSGDRQPLLDAYHDEATFSLCNSSSQRLGSRCHLREYHEDSRNLKQLKDPSTRFRLLKHKRLNVVALLNKLPKTQHDITSFNVNLNTHTTRLLSFTVSGVFKEVAGAFRNAVRAFSRVFIAVPALNSGLCIVNDQLFVRIATRQEVCSAFAAPTPSSSLVPALSPLKQEMLSVFSLKSSMNLEWSKKCLQDNNWDFNKAAQIFTQLKTEGKIPDVAFIK